MGGSEMFSIAICDDELAAANMVSSTLRQALDHRGVRYRCDVFTDSRALSDRLRSGATYDVLFTDIDMPNTGGISLAMQFKEQLADSILVYVSGREDLVFDTFRTQPFRFVRKRDLETTLPTIMSEVWDEYQHRQNRKMSFRSGADTILIRPEKIVYVESILKSQVLHTVDRTYELQSSLQKLMQQLDGHGFIQIHKSYYVNCRYIASINRSSLVLDDGTDLPIGRAYLRQTQEAFQVFVLNDI